MLSTLIGLSERNAALIRATGAPFDQKNYGGQISLQWRSYHKGSGTGLGLFVQINVNNAVS